MSRPPGLIAVRAEDLQLAHDDHVAVAGGGFEIPTGTVTALIGPNGSGKSSVLDAIAGLLDLRSGRLDVLPDDPDGGLAYVLQSTEIPAHLPMTVREVVTMGRYGRTGLLRPIGAAGRAAVAAAMERTDVVDLADRRILELSGGQRQRVLVAQGLAAEAALLLLDEPMTGLDLVSAQRIRDVVDAERDAGRTIVYSTHDLTDAAGADRVVLLAGRVVASGAPADVLVEEHLRDAYRGHVAGVGGLAIIDDPHHHGGRTDRHDGHDHP